MDIYINNAKADITLEDEKTIEDVLKGIETECEKMDATIIGVSIDGTEIDAEELSNRFSDLIENTSTLEITTICKDDIVSYFQAINETLEELEQNLTEIPVQLQSGKEIEATETVKLFAESFDNFCKAVTLSSLFSEYFANTKEKAQKISDFLADFAPILSDFENAFKDKDTVLIGDLSEYEIAPRIAQMKEFCSEFIK